jgi:hypothetical protein
MIQKFKKIFFVSLVLSFVGCGLHGWFPGWDENPKISTTQPTQGCNRDLIVHYKNNCSKELIMYFIEINPGSTFNCETLGGFGNMAANEMKTVTIHKGKLGYFVFAEDAEGKCNIGHRQAEAWVSCENATSGEASFDICH